MFPFFALNAPFLLGRALYWRRLCDLVASEPFLSSRMSCLFNIFTITGKQGSIFAEEHLHRKENLFSFRRKFFFI
jgi:hypothetical protein